MAPTLVTEVPATGYRIDIDGDYAYLAGIAVTVVDISNPRGASVVGRVENGGFVPRTRAVTVAGSHVYAVYQLLSGGGNMQVIETAHPAFARQGELILAEGHATAVAVDGSHVYIGTSSGAPCMLRVFDFLNPDCPSAGGGINTGGDVSGLDVVRIVRHLVPFTYVTVVSNGAIEIYIVSNSDNLSFVGGSGPSGASAVDVVGTQAYVAYSGVSGGGLTILDLSTPAAPVVLGGVAISVSSHARWGVAMAGAHAYVATGSSLEVVGYLFEDD